MKHTTFHFVLRLAGEQPNELFDAVLAKLKSLKNVDRVERDITKPDVALCIYCSFPDAETAQLLHRKTMTTLMRMDGVSITRVTSNLTEIFD